MLKKIWDRKSFEVWRVIYLHVPELVLVLPR